MSLSTVAAQLNTSRKPQRFPSQHADRGPWLQQLQRRQTPAPWAQHQRRQQDQIGQVWRANRAKALHPAGAASTRAERPAEPRSVALRREKPAGG